MQEVGFRTLRFFLALYTCGNVSQASAQIGVGQPSGSAMLAKLRRYFSDPLFVPVSHHMLPTPRTEEIVGSVREVLRLLDQVREEDETFDPRTSKREFRIAMTDISELTLLPKLCNEIRDSGSQVCLSVQELNERTPDALASGETDLAVGFITQIGLGFMQQLLFRQKYVCLASSNHPRLRRKLTLERYLREKHVMVNVAGTGHRLIEDDLRRRKLKRDIALTVPSFLGVGHVVAYTDLLATVPEIMAQELVHEHCMSFPLPFDIAEFAVRQYWHARFRNDAGHRWLRELVVRSCRDMGG